MTYGRDQKQVHVIVLLGWMPGRPVVLVTSAPISFPQKAETRPASTGRQARHCVAPKVVRATSGNPHFTDHAD